MATAKVLLLDIGNRQLKTKLGDDCNAFDWHDAVALKNFEAYLRISNFDILVYACSAPQVEAQVLDVINTYPSKKILAQHIALEIVSTNTGIDRLLTAFAASKIASTPVIVLDFGTAFTVDVVDTQNHFRGGAIGLGLGSQLWHRRCRTLSLRLSPVKLSPHQPKRQSLMAPTAHWLLLSAAWLSIIKSLVSKTLLYSFAEEMLIACVPCCRTTASKTNFFLTECN